MRVLIIVAAAGLSNCGYPRLNDTMRMSVISSMAKPGPSRPWTSSLTWLTSAFFAAGVAQGNRYGLSA
jgi:hypothetical protein